MIDKIVKYNYDILLRTDYKRMKKGLRLGVDGKPYKIVYYDRLIKYFAEIEEYEKCILLKNIKYKITNHDDNYLLDSKILKLVDVQNEDEKKDSEIVVNCME